MNKEQELQKLKSYLQLIKNSSESKKRDQMIKQLEEKINKIENEQTVLK